MSIHSSTRAPTEGLEATSRSDGAIRNKILKLLPAADRAPLVGRSKVVQVRSQEILFQPEEELEYVHFPEDCVISLVTVMEDGDQVEAMTIGNDGFSGIPVFHGVETSKHKGCGQISGTSRRVSAKDFRDLAQESAPRRSRPL